MKLFTKTVIFFISVIIFQSGLTTFFITNITKRSNLEDALKELNNETVSVLDNYHSWKRRMWKTLIDIQQDQQIKAMLQPVRQEAFTPPLPSYLKEKLVVSGIDIFVLKHSLHTEVDIISITYNNLALSDLQELERQKPHPYITFNLLSNQLCLIGSIRLVTDENSSERASSFVDIFLIKRINQEFCQQLIVNRNAHVVFFLDNHYLNGTLDERRFEEISGGMRMTSGLYGQYEMEIEEPGYNIAVRKLEKVLIHEQVRQLSLAALLSNAPYITRLTVLEKTVLYVTVVSALLTIILSLFLSQNITRPIKKLLSAMHRVRGGAYDTTIDIQSHNEIGELFQGFNAMARQLFRDTAQMEDYIHEITALKEYNEKIIHSIRAGILIMNQEMDVEKVNKVFLDYFHLSEPDLLGKNICEMDFPFLDEDIVRHIQAILLHPEREYTTIKRTSPNMVYEIQLYPVEHHIEHNEHPGESAGCMVVVEDISRKVEFEEKISQAEKLSSISMLSAGVAHEINNPLGSIMTNVQNLIEEEEDEDKCTALRWIEQETRRIARIVQKLLDFSSSNPEHTHGANVNRVIADTVTLITYSLKRHQDITIITEFEESLPLTVMSQDELKQTMINLIKNSIQAIERQGTISITTKKNPHDQTILVMVKDTGIGMKEEIIPRIFDPFFTTKQNGDGTGLGLSVVYGIIGKYQGTIAVDSREGQGTQVCLSLPWLEAR